MRTETPAPLPSSTRALVDALFRQEKPYVRRVLLRYGVPLHDLDDACQEVFLVVWRRIESFRGSSHVRTWLHGISRRVAASQRRRAVHRYERSMDALPTPNVVDPQLAVEPSVQLRLIDRALPAIAENEREVLLLRTLRGLTMREIAVQANCCIATAYIRLAAARRELSLVVGSAS